MPEFIWRGVEVESLERARVSQGVEVQVESVIDSARGRYSYELVCAADWTFRSLHLEALAGHRSFDLVRGDDGAWTLDDVERADLAEAVDLDLAISPLTNTLPIRRLDLGIDDEADIVAAYVSFPDLEIVADPQRYTRLDEDAYVYESLDSDFEAELTVDAAGFVLEYPGLFERL
ncbi:putative glycolipid-binding domain-containing protein [Pseudolysinimonas sp.]|uniref:putative glycolipid-binding domain-containing protein n=1 Tax=Pseudolysinimonas sp. TaxID=2680009 RepID=UPI003F7FD524